MRQDIEPIQAFAARQREDLGMHSLLNDFNVILGQLYILGILLRDDEYAYSAAIERTKAFLVELQARPDPLVYIWRLIGFHQQYLDDCFAAVKDLSEEIEGEEIDLTLQTVDSTFSKLMRRAAEVYPLVEDGFQTLEESCNPEIFWKSLPGLEWEDPAEIRFLHYRSTRERVWVRLRVEDPMTELLEASCICPVQLLIPYLLDHAGPGGGVVELELIKQGETAGLVFKKVSFPEGLLERVTAGEAVEPEGHLAAFFLGCRWLEGRGCRVAVESRGGETGFVLSLEKGISSGE